MVKRSAFTMIELIFAIVIMAIVIIALPRMMRTNSNALEANIDQEAVFGASAALMQTLSYPWDTNSPGNNGSYNKIVAIPNYAGTGNYGRYFNNSNQYDTNGSFRIGAILESGHRRFHPYNASDANISGLKQTSPNPLCQTSATTPFINNSPSAQGYKKAYMTTTTVSYIPDTNDANNTFVFSSTGETNSPTNIKLVTVSILNAVTDKPIVLLRSYSANIGETSFYSRTY